MRYFRYHNCNLECPYFRAKNIESTSSLIINGIDVEDRFNDIEDELSDINIEVGTIQSDITTLDGRVDTTETDINALELADVSLDGRIDTLETKTSYQTSSTGLTSISSDIDMTNGVLVVKSTGANVGINVASPSYDMDVLGDVNTSSSYKVSGNTVINGTSLGSGVVSSSLTSVGTLSALTISGDLTVDTNTLFVNSSTNRVGVGTLNPTSSIHTTGSITADANLLATGYCKAAFIGARVKRTTNITFDSPTSMFTGIAATYNAGAGTGSGYSSTTGGFTPRFTGYYRVTFICRADDGAGTKGFTPVTYSTVTETYTNIIPGDGVFFLPYDGQPRRMGVYTLTGNFASTQTIFMMAYTPASATYMYYEMIVDFLGV